jgi:hypothetical protein
MKQDFNNRGTHCPLDAVHWGAPRGCNAAMPIPRSIMLRWYVCLILAQRSASCSVKVLVSSLNLSRLASASVAKV